MAELNCHCMFVDGLNGIQFIIPCATIHPPEFRAGSQDKVYESHKRRITPEHFDVIKTLIASLENLVLYQPTFQTMEAARVALNKANVSINLPEKDYLNQ